MPTPPKPFKVIESENKSHRTKAEMSQRKQQEEALISGVKLKERSEVKQNKLAHKEFVRVNNLLKKIEKNDALYEPIINRYCIILSECYDLEMKREEFTDMVRELREGFKETQKYIKDENERAVLMIEFTREISRITNSILCIDGVVQQKRKMLLDIEKENIFTIASALRSIPKKLDKKEQSGMAAMLAKRQAR
jgi:hypothetical protein